MPHNRGIIHVRLLPVVNRPKITMLYETDVWLLKMMPGWEATKDEECITFAKIDSGFGAFQISCYVKVNGFVTDEELEDFAEGDSLDGADVEKVNFPIFTGIYARHVTGANYWRRWWLRSGSVMIYATYNCEAVHKDVEQEDVNQMIMTLKPA